ncbi:hypothetical protein B0H17DRAFT_1184754 [Mycena rosella]|uniref:Uncharacterized protein n=1 Tax=Mycena rosella TaxID=1033263 RepID=A0AAD7G466_MYCRO|nr:hypothetical protein B0H17DRAFT_1184754 [Mycena rosella]
MDYIGLETGIILKRPSLELNSHRIAFGPSGRNTILTVTWPLPFLQATSTTVIVTVAERSNRSNFYPIVAPSFFTKFYENFQCHDYFQATKPIVTVDPTQKRQRNAAIVTVTVASLQIALGALGGIIGGTNESFREKTGAPGNPDKIFCVGHSASGPREGLRRTDKVHTGRLVEIVKELPSHQRSVAEAPQEFKVRPDEQESVPINAPCHSTFRYNKREGVRRGLDAEETSPGPQPCSEYFSRESEPQIHGSKEKYTEISNIIQRDGGVVAHLFENAVVLEQASRDVEFLGQAENQFEISAFLPPEQLCLYEGSMDYPQGHSLQFMILTCRSKLNTTLGIVLVARAMGVYFTVISH